MPPRREKQALTEAIAALHATLGVKAKLLPLPKRLKAADALLQMTLQGKRQMFLVMVKTVDRRIALAQIRAQLQILIDQHRRNYQPLLITGFATADMAEECRRLELPFLDAAGNLYLRTGNFFAYVKGQQRPDRRRQHEYRANHAAGLRVTFALLCKPALAAATQRDLARLAGVGLGTVGPILADLTQRGFLRKGKTRGHTLTQARELLNEWVTYYPANLRPTLAGRRYQAARERLIQTDLAPYGACWGGEYGAEQLTRYLKAERFVIYTPGAAPAGLLAQARLRQAAEGNTEVYETFWHPELLEPPGTVAPPLLIYADLMATADPRNLEAAKQIYERFLEPALRQ